MSSISRSRNNSNKKNPRLYALLGVLVLVAACGAVMAGLTVFAKVSKNQVISYTASKAVVSNIPPAPIVPVVPVLPPLDTKAFDLKNIAITNGDTSGRWPVKSAYPSDGALLPFNRIVAYYGNFYSKNMGVLGEYSTDIMLAKLQSEVKKWEAADPTTPVIPAIHYIAVTAQGSAGSDGKYRARMPFTEIDKAVALANKVHGVAFVDVQTGLSNVQTEVPLLETYLKMPNVHLGIDPEFNTGPKGNKKPGTVIGTIDAKDINFVTDYLAKVVRDNHIPPKIFVIHRFTQGMVTNYQNIVLHPEVQIVMDMDGWGGGPHKLAAYRDYIEAEPVQFTGFKLFYKNDIRNPGSTMLTPNDVLKLVPAPSYIQYQ